MRERDTPNLDEFDLPDIPDDADVEAADQAEGADGADGPAGGDGSAIGRRLAPVLAQLTPLLARLADATAPLGRLARRLLEPVGRVAAPAGRALAPVAAATGALVALVAARVPAVVLAGLGSFVGVLALTLIAFSLLSGGQRPAEASLPPTRSAAEAVDHAPPTATPRPASTPTPSGPTPTPTPTLWERRDGGWVARGAPLPNPMHVLRPEAVHFLDDRRETFEMRVKLEVLHRSGPLSPWWGLVLGYQDETHNLRLQFVSDSYAQDKPGASLVVSEGATTRSLGGAELPGITFWGRDSHTLRVVVDEQQIEAWLNDEPMRTWPNPKRYLDQPKGVYVLGPSAIRFDQIEIR